jgi:hypothetical protein
VRRKEEGKYLLFRKNSKDDYPLNIQRQLLHTVVIYPSVGSVTHKAKGMTQVSCPRLEYTVKAMEFKHVEIFADSIVRRD